MESEDPIVKKGRSLVEELKLERRTEADRELGCRLEIGVALLSG
jgi:hypothetical protein